MNQTLFNRVSFRTLSELLHDEEGACLKPARYVNNRLQILLATHLTAVWELRIIGHHLECGPLDGISVYTMKMCGEDPCDMHGCTPVVSDNLVGQTYCRYRCAFKQSGAYVLIDFTRLSDGKDDWEVCDIMI